MLSIQLGGRTVMAGKPDTEMREVTVAEALGAMTHYCLREYDWTFCGIGMGNGDCWVFMEPKFDHGATCKECLRLAFGYHKRYWSCWLIPRDVVDKVLGKKGENDAGKTKESLQ